jgi:branched-chain amino acid transport system substrate-binding protein
MMTQYHSIAGNDVEQFKKSGKVTVLYPKEYKTGDVKAPYEGGKK